MHGIYLWRAAGSGAPQALAPGLTACLQLLDRATTATATATTATTTTAQPAAAAARHPTPPGGALDDPVARAAAKAPHSGATAAATGRGSRHVIAAVAPAVSGAAAVSSSSSSSSGSGSRGSSSGGHSATSSPAAAGAAGSKYGPGFGSRPGCGTRGCSGGTGGRAGGGSGWRWRGGSAGAHGGGGGGGGGAGAGTGFVFGSVAAVAVAAAAGFVASTALADSPSSEEALAAVQRELTAAWGEVEEEMARLNARLPAHAPSLKGEPPTVVEVQGAVEVAVPLREGADVNAVLRELRQGLGGSGVTSYSESVFGASRTVRMEIRQAGGDAVRAMMFVPPPGGSEQAQVVVSKRGPFSPEELSSLRRLVRAANVTFGLDQPARGAAAKRHGLHGGADPEAQARALEGLLHSLARSALSELVAGPMQQIMEELQRGLGEEDQQEEDGEGEGAGFGGFGAPGGGSFPGLPPPPPPAQPHRVKGGGGGGGGAGGHEWGSPTAARAVEQLLAMGAQVFPPGSKDKMDWGVLAGYEDQKRTLEDCLLLPLLRPDVYTRLARATRKTFANNRPRAVLFEGPPGTGKTTSARVISSQAAVPLIYLPLEAVLSKWYGQSEQQLGAVFKAAEEMGGAIIFLDELDALGGNREGGGLHEVSRRLLSVLLREMEGFDADAKRTVVIGATNRKTDLDPALLSRFDLIISFGLPDSDCRQLILRQYAQQLSEGEVAQLAERTGGMSGRDLRDVCEHTERRWASKIIRGEVREEELPPLAEYLASADERATAVQRVQQQSVAAGAINRLLGAAGGGGGGGRPSGLASWLSGSQQ